MTQLPRLSAAWQILSRHLPHHHISAKPVTRKRGNRDQHGKQAEISKVAALA